MERVSQEFENCLGGEWVDGGEEEEGVVGGLINYPRVL